MAFELFLLLTNMCSLNLIWFLIDSLFIACSVTLDPSLFVKLFGGSCSLYSMVFVELGVPEKPGFGAVLCLGELGNLDL